MKILFVVTGIGFGDSTREHVNIEAVKKAYPRAKVLVACYDNSYEYFKDKYDCVKIKGYNLPGKQLKIQLPQFVLSNLFLPLFWFTSTLKVSLEEFNFVPDVIVSDFEPVGLSLARLLGKKCLVVFGYDPLLYKEYKKNNKISIKMRTQAIYFEYLYKAANMIALPTIRKPKPKKLDYIYTNPIIRKIPSKLKDEKKLMKELGLVKKPILVMLGGSDFGTTLVHNIAKVGKKMKENFIIFGGNLDIKLPKNMSYIRFTPDFLKYLKVCKGVITLGGQITLAESLVYGKPILCFPIKGHVEQVLNAYAIKDVAMIGNSGSVKELRKLLPSFVKSIPSMKKKVVEYGLKAGGEREIVNMVKVALEK